MQQTLFGKKEEESKTPKPAAKSTSIPSNVYVVEPQEVKSDETHAAFRIRAIVTSTLEGKKVTIDATQALEIKPYPQKYSCYGGFWGLGNTYNKENLKQIFDDILFFKKKVLELPYTKNLEDSHRYTNLKDSNVFIEISDKTKTFIEKKTGTNWNDFLKKFNSIKNKIAPKGYDELVNKERKLEKEIESKEKSASRIKEDYIDKIDTNENNLLGFSKNPNEIFSEYIKLKSSINQLKRKLKEVNAKLDSEG